MIKLFWNTHNQKKPNSQNKKVREKEESDLGWGQYHKNNSDKWIYEILKKAKYSIIDSLVDLEKDDILIIVDSSVEEKNELYTKLSLICSKVFLFHLGDEFGFHNLLPIYNNCNYIWRPFCSSRYFNNEKVTENINGPLQERPTNQAGTIYYFNFLILNHFFVTKQKSLIVKIFQLMK